jgi:hypothetical protein
VDSPIGRWEGLGLCSLWGNRHSVAVLRVASYSFPSVRGELMFSLIDGGVGLSSFQSQWGALNICALQDASLLVMFTK